MRRCRPLERSALCIIIACHLQSLGSEAIGGRDEGRGDVHPLGHRARATRWQRNDFYRWSTTNCAGWPPSGSRRRSPARPCSRPPWFTRPTSGSSGRARLPHWDGCGHFFAAAAEAMRRILVEQARRKRSLKRGGGRRREPADLDALLAGGPAQEVLALHEALEQLAAHDPVKAKLVEMRFFAGLTLEQAAECLGISPSTADRAWRYARAWLYTAMAGPDSGEK